MTFDLTDLLWSSVGLLLILEGLLPLLLPRMWQQNMQRLSQLPPGQLRTIGVLSVLAGVVILNFVA